MSASAEPYRAALIPTPLAYEPTRTLTPQDPDRWPGMGLVLRPEAMGQYALSYMFAQVDPCAPEPFRTDWWPAGPWHLRQLRKTRDDRPDPVIGCDHPKLRLLGPSVVGSSPDAVERQIAELGVPSDAVIIHATHMPEAWRQSGAVDGAIRVDRFSGNALSLTTTVRGSDGAWLVYADSFHPGWRARVNGRTATVFEANGAFKAVRVDAGESRVELAFVPRLEGFASHSLALIGVLAALALLGLCAWALMQPTSPTLETRPQ